LREYAQYHQIVRIEKQERTKNLKHPTLQPIKDKEQKQPIVVRKTPVNQSITYLVTRKRHRQPDQIRCKELLSQHKRQPDQ